MDINPKRVALCREEWGMRAHLPEEIRGMRFRKVFVNPSSVAAVKTGLEFVRRGGSVLLFAPLPPGEEVRLDFNRLYFDEISLIPSYSAGPEDTRAALRLISEGVVRPSRYITLRMGFGELARAFQEARREDVVKVVVYI